MPMKRPLWRFAFFLLAGLSFATGASAQPYVGGSILVDIIRMSGPADDTPGSGEAIGGGLRIGAALRNQWGIDLEFARSGDVEWQPDVRILADVTRSLSGAIGVPPNIAIFPSPQFSAETQLSTLTTMLWWRQEVNDRFDLVYLGGAAFTRTATNSNVSYILSANAGILPFPQFFEQESITYDTGVAVGIDGSIAMTDHLRLVPGFRLISVASRWILRPSAGLQWKF
jgi:hypothetical protein